MNTDELHAKLDGMKPSELLRLAVKDCRAYDELVKKDPKHHEWEMGLWVHFMPDTQTCSACMAGAVLHQRFDEITLVDTSNGDSPRDWMWAVDAMRAGVFDSLMERLAVGDDEKHVVQVRLNERFDALRREASIQEALGNKRLPSRRLTWEGYDQLADVLEEEGL